MSGMGACRCRKQTSLQTVKAVALAARVLLLLANFGKEEAPGPTYGSVSIETWHLVIGRPR
jgi:hypothetical protein